MYEVYGYSKRTNKYELIVSEISKQELELVLLQEQVNYYGIKVMKLRYR